MTTVAIVEQHIYTCSSPVIPGPNVIQPFRTASARKAFETGELLPSIGLDLRDDTVSICDQDRFAQGGRADILAKPILQYFNAGGTQEVK